MSEYIASSSTTYREFNKTRDEKRKEAILKIGTVTAAGVGAYAILGTPEGQSAASRLFKLNTLNDYFRLNGNLWTDLQVKKRISLGDLALNAVKTAEEISPLKILRTFHSSSFISPYAVPNESNPVHITSTQFLLDREYFRKLVADKGNNVHSSVVDSMFRHGAVFQNGQLLTHDKSSVILEHAKIVSLSQMPLHGPDEHTPPFLNRTYQKFRNIIGLHDDSRFYTNALSEKGGIGIIAGTSKQELFRDWSRAQGRLYLEPAFKLFDKPLDVLAEVIDKSGLPDKFHTAGHIRDRLTVNMGTAGDYTQSVPSSFIKMGKAIGKASIVGAIGYNLLDYGSRAIASSDSPYSHGIIPGVASVYTGARTSFASMWSDNFQDYKAKQEAAAEGSTSLSTLAGFPLAGALAGSMYGYGRRLADAGVEGVARADVIAHTESESKALNKILSKAEGSGPKLNRVGKYAAIGALIGAVPILPFLPGALIGESSEELEKKYSGDTDVAVRSTRFWGSGGTQWEGGKIKYFSKSWYAQLLSGAEDAGQYGDQDRKDELNPVLHPFDYLRNPYRKEEYNQDQSPYPVWGMDVSYAGSFGKLIQGTIGKAIKPDIINNRLDDYTESNTSARAQLADGGMIDLKVNTSNNEASLIKDGMMLAPGSAVSNVNSELAHTSYSALTDFAGLKGWMASLASNEMQTGFGDPGLQLGRSGEMANSAREIKEANIGGMGPIGESLRRFIPTNAGSVLDRSNPLRNQMPEWLPHDIDNYWLDFSTGDPYRKVEQGYERLPGDGYAAVHKELKGIDPADYPDIFKFKILSDVAMGSDEYYEYKDKFAAKAKDGSLTDFEKDIYDTTTQQTIDRSVQKDFYERPNDSVVSTYWDKITGLVELPTESLTFMRPGAKLVHKRNALEDYVDTQVEGNDVGMWTSPYSHFLKPTLNKLSMSEDVPDSVLDKRGINKYFDTLEYYKYRKLYKESVDSGDAENARLYKNKYQTTLTGALTTGLDDNMEVTRAYIAMPSEEKAYFASFSGYTSSSDRERVIDLESTDIANIYSKLWERRDAITNNSGDSEAQAEAIREITDKEERDLKVNNKALLLKYNATGASKHSTFSEYVADTKAEEYIKATTGMPDSSFSGWDPRINIKDIKLKTLELGKEDVRSFGFWQGDEERVRRITAIQEDKEVINSIDEIKQGIRKQKAVEMAIKSDMYSRGISVDSVQFHTSKTEDINLNIGA